MKRSIRKAGWLALAAALGLQGAALADGPSTRSGQYGVLSLVVIGDRLGGVFFDQRGEDGPGGPPMFSCSFLIQGRIEGDHAAVDSWEPDTKDHIAGTLAFTAGGMSLTLNDNHGGCTATSGDMVHAPYEGSRDGDGAGWIGVALVKAKRTSFRHAPGAPPPRRPFVVAFDPLVILERKGAWVRASYPEGEKPVIGWLPAADLAVVELGRGP